MTFLTPITALVAAGISVPLLVLLYFLKLRRRELVVSSTLLWKKTIHDLQVNAPFQKLRRNLLLLLQLLILAALLMALARPTYRALAPAGQRTVLLIDHSASMNATDLQPSRLEAAKRWARAKIDELEGSAGVMVVAFTDRARVVQPFTSDRSLLRRAIDSVSPTDRFSHISPGLQLVEPYAMEAAGDPAGTGATKPLEVFVLTDGRFQEQATTALHGGRLSFVRFAADPARTAVDNLAIVACSARRDPAKPQNVQVLARLANYSDRPVSANVSLLVNGRPRGVAPVEVPPAAPPAATTPPAPGAPGTRSVEFGLTSTTTVVLGVAHDHADQLAADDAACVQLAAPKRLRVLLVTEGNAFLERALDAAGVEKLLPMTPKRYEDQDPLRLRRSGSGASEEGFDVIVFDHYSPRGLPAVDSLYLGGVPPLAGLERRGAGAHEPRVQAFLSWQRDHPLLRYVVLDDVILAEPGRLALPEKAVVLATGQAGPLLAEIMHEGVRHVCASFSILQTNWPMQTSFMVFTSNALELLSLGGAGGGAVGYRPGDVAVVPTDARAASRTVVFEGPARLEAPAADGRATLPAFERVGVYQAAGGAVPAPFDKLTVNLQDALESDLRPAETLEVGTVPVRVLAAESAVRQEVWRWFAWGALAVLMVEWLIYTRRMHL